MSEPDETIPIGEIVAKYFLSADGRPEVAIEHPDFETVPIVVQLGMVELIRDTLLHGLERRLQHDQ
jgi:hypothetical protein